MYIVMMTKWQISKGYLYSTIIDQLDYETTAAEYIKACLENMRGDEDEPYPWGQIGEDEEAELIVYDPDNKRNGFPAWVNDQAEEANR